MATTTKASEFKLIQLRDIRTNQAQSRGMGVLSKLLVNGYGVFEKLKGHEDKEPIWLMLLSSDAKVQKEAVKLIDDAEPAMAGLARGLEADGQLEPIGVRELSNGDYDVIFGMRRALAAAYNYAKVAGSLMVEAKVFVTKKTTIELLLMALAENDDRQDESPIDKALTYERLKKEGKLTNKEIAEKTRQTSQNVGNYLKLLSPKLADKRSAIHEGTISIARALKMLEKLEGRTNASDQTPAGAGARYRLPGTKTLVRIYTAPSKPSKMDDDEWELWKDAGVRKLLAFKLGLEFKEWEGSDEEEEEEAATTANGTAPEGANAKVSTPKVLKIGRGLADKLLISLGKTDAATWDDAKVSDWLTNIVNHVEDGQKAETDSLQKILDKLVDNYAKGGKVEVTKKEKAKSKK